MRPGRQLPSERWPYLQLLVPTAHTSQPLHRPGRLPPIAAGSQQVSLPGVCPLHSTLHTARLCSKIQNWSSLPCSQPSSGAHGPGDQVQTPQQTQRLLQNWPLPAVQTPLGTPPPPAPRHRQVSPVAPLSGLRERAASFSCNSSSSSSQTNPSGLGFAVTSPLRLAQVPLWSLRATPPFTSHNHCLRLTPEYKTKGSCLVSSLS